MLLQTSQQLPWREKFTKEKNSPKLRESEYQDKSSVKIKCQKHNIFYIYSIGNQKQVWKFLF